ncbi:hypothetical protein BGZ57DRAFT_865791 [Hyaloscypha finlandica]|nr:hypothetical protein BGZ57DRAFT_865791 [Hyaloscypha finlandica]
MGCTLHAAACMLELELASAIHPCSDLQSWWHQVLVVPQSPKGDSQRQGCRKKVDLEASRARQAPPPFRTSRVNDVRDPDSASRCI